MARMLSLRAVLLVLIASAGAYVLLIPPVIGLANQGDFVRFMQPFGLAYPANIAPADRFWWFCDLTFAFTRPGGWHGLYMSSQIPIIAGALGLHRLLSTSAWFDIRYLSALHLVILLAIFWKLTGTMRSAGREAWIAGTVFAAVVVSDVGYLAYFNSFYAEPAIILFGILFISCLFDCLREPRMWNLLLLAAAAFLLITAKPQNALLGFVIGPFVAGVPFLRKNWRPLLTYCVLIGAGLAGTGACAAIASNPADRLMTLYATVFTGVLTDSENPRADLAALGIDPRAVTYEGSNPFADDTAVSAGYFPGRCNYKRLLKFYIFRPGRLFRRTGRVIEEVMSNRLPMLGNYQRGTGHQPQEQARCFSLWDSIRSRFHSIGLLAGFFLVTVSIAWFRAIRSNSANSYGYLLLAAMALVSFYTAALGDGADYRKHMLLFHLLFDACCCCSVMFAASGVRQFVTARRTRAGTAARTAA